MRRVRFRRSIRDAVAVLAVTVIASIALPVGAAAAAGVVSCADVPVGTSPPLYASDDAVDLVANTGYYVAVDIGANDGCIDTAGTHELSGTPVLRSAPPHVGLDTSALDAGVVRILVEYGFCGLDSFTYWRAGDAAHGNTATVTVTVAPAPGSTCAAPPHDGVLVDISGAASYAHGGDIALDSAYCYRDGAGLRQVTVYGNLPGIDGRPSFIGLGIAFSDAAFIGFVDIDDPAFSPVRVRVPFAGTTFGGDARSVYGAGLGRMPNGGLVVVRWAVRDTRADTTEPPGGTGCMAPLS